MRKFPSLSVPLFHGLENGVKGRAPTLGLVVVGINKLLHVISVVLSVQETLGNLRFE